MKLKDFATAAGVEVSRCEKAWGGTWAYSSRDTPNALYCGYRTEAALYKAWARDTFGEGATKALMGLLAETQRRGAKQTKASER